RSQPSLITCFAGHDARLQGELVNGTGQSLPRHPFVRVRQFEHHPAGLHVGHPPLWGSFTGTHPSLSRLLGQRTVREDVDPYLAATPKVPVDGNTSGLNLAVGHVVTLDRLNAVLAECQRRPALRDTTTRRVMLLAVLDPAGDQHDSVLLLVARGGLARSGVRGRRRGRGHRRRLRRLDRCRRLLSGHLGGRFGRFSRLAGLALPATSRTTPLRTAPLLGTRLGSLLGRAVRPRPGDVALVDPHLDADATERGPGLVEAVVN